jgi:phage terminase small subunit
MPGPRPQPIALRLLRGNPSKRPIRRGFEPPQPPLPPSPPSFWTGYAREEWDRVAPGLHLFGLLTEIDVMVLAAYCEAFKRWKTAVEALDRVAALDQQCTAFWAKAARARRGSTRSSESRRRPRPI